MAFQIKDLKKIIDLLPEDTEVLYQDPNFSGAYDEEITEEDFNFDGKNLLISFPFESPV